MKKWLTLLALTLAPALAHADLEYFIKPSGVDNSSGSNGQSFKTAWKTIQFANANLLAPNTARGNIKVYVDRATYTGAINPVAVPIDGKRFTFIPLHFNGTTYDEQTRVAGGTISPTSTTIMGFRINTALTLGNVGVTLDSLNLNHIVGGLGTGGSDSLVVYRNFIDTGRFLVGNVNTGLCLGNDVVENTMNLTGNSGEKLVWLGRPATTAAGHTEVSHVERMRMYRNRVTTTVTGCAGDGDFFHRYFSNTYRSRFEDNWWKCINTGNGPNTTNGCGSRPFRMRDSTHSNQFIRDTLIALNSDNSGGGNTFKTVIMSSSNAIDTGTPQEVTRTKTGYNNLYLNCRWITDAALEWGNSFINDSLVGNVFVVDHLEVMAGTITGNVIDHNTFISRDNSSDGRGVLSWFEATTWGPDTTRVTNNIFARQHPGTQITGLGASSPNSNLCGQYVQDHNSQGATNQFYEASVLVSNWNLYAVFPYHDIPGDRSLGGHKNGCCTIGEYPDGSTGAYEDMWQPQTRGNADSLSKWGSARFGAGGPDSTWGVNFNPTLGTNSRAHLMSSTGEDVGATGYDAPGPAIYPIIHPSTYEILFGNNLYPTSNALVSAPFALTNEGNDTLRISRIESNYNANPPAFPFNPAPPTPPTHTSLYEFQAAAAGPGPGWPDRGLYAGPGPGLFIMADFFDGNYVPIPDISGGQNESIPLRFYRGLAGSESIDPWEPNLLGQSAGFPTSGWIDFYSNDPTTPVLRVQWRIADTPLLSDDTLYEE